jgi:hypothetical protein
MKINLNKAITTFYPNPSLEQVYFEAIANSFDAQASEISIVITIEAFDKPDTLRITIIDNGKGFSDIDFQKFSSLLEVESSDHKGLGRLVYLAYFSEAAFESHFGNSTRRSFVFNNTFEGDCKVDDHTSPSGTTINYRHFAGEKIKSYAYLVPGKIKESILQHFLPLLLHKQESGESLGITISLDVSEPNPDYDFVTSQVTLTLNDLPVLVKESIQESSLDFFQNIEVRYSITLDRTRERAIYHIYLHRWEGDQLRVSSDRGYPFRLSAGISIHLGILHW